ncbi:MAG TPA: lysophospholipid acyltransferase family protein [Guyparkeria sp.]|nr:lysophospholipid acyltransferase family protein [Guyparkeria sp.]
MRTALRATVRLLRLLGYLATGLWRAGRLGRMQEGARLEFVRSWQAGVPTVLGVAVHICGEEQLDALTANGGSLWLPNHISWLDIPLLGGICPGTIFLAKSEIRRWPVIGRLAMHAGTAFIERGQGSEAAAVAVAGGLAQGRQVVVFPEGTTSDGRQVRHFHARMLGPAIEAGRPIVPVALRYRDARGQLSTAPAFVGQELPWASFWRVLAADGLEAWIDILEPIEPQTGETRSEIARRAQQAVAAIVSAD